MKRWIKWTAIGLGIALLLLAGAVALGMQLAERKRSRQVAVQVQAVAYATDAQALERGRYLFLSRGCVDCHGAGPAGRAALSGRARGSAHAGRNRGHGPPALGRLTRGSHRRRPGAPLS